MTDDEWFANDDDMPDDWFDDDHFKCAGPMAPRNLDYDDLPDESEDPYRLEDFDD